METFTISKTGMYRLARVRIIFCLQNCSLILISLVPTTKLIKKQLSFYPKISRFGNYDFFFYISKLSRLSQEKWGNVCLPCIFTKKRNKVTLHYMSKTLNINPFHVARVMKQKRADHLSPNKRLGWNNF